MIVNETLFRIGSVSKLFTWTAVMQLFEGNLNNQKIIKHGGDTPIFHSLLVLLPEQNVGLFVSFNSPEGAARSELLQAFLDRYYPYIFAHHLSFIINPY
ncbi:MAG: beta-lactamase family protein [Methanosarcinales archaeon]|nr:beta-lactamase family protein [Methanosarcinales archaeon]